MIRAMMRRVLEHIDRFLVQSEESARRFIDLGADPGRVVVTGSLKFDSLELSSTASAVAAAAPNTLLLLAPRNPERFGEAESLARSEGWKVARRSDLAVDSEPRVDVVI